MNREYTRAGEIVLIIEETESEGFYLYSFYPDGFEGDTNHETLDDAKHQAEAYGVPDLRWSKVPADVKDLGAFGRQISN